jgi:CHAD domain-containing protein/CYTH domain-containing protein
MKSNRSSNQAPKSEQDVATVVRKEATRRLNRALKAAASARRPTIDPTALHAFRVAVRRLRSVERAFRPWLPDLLGRSGRRLLRAVARATNEARDLETLIERVAPTVAFLPPGDASRAAEILRGWRAKKTRAYRTTVKDAVETFEEGATKLLRRLGSFARRKGRPSDPPPVPFLSAAAEAARVAAKRLDDAIARTSEPRDDAAAHDARIAAKRLRYLLETAGASRPEADVAAERARALQDALGDFRDWRAAEAALASADATGAATEPPNALATLAARRADAAFLRFRELASAPGTLSPAALADSIAGAAPRAESYVEIERKFLLSGVPPAVKSAPFEDLAQGYLPGRRLIERVRRHRPKDGPARYFRTVKGGVGAARVEIEEETTRALFELLWKATKGRRVKKRRHRVDDGPRTWEIDVFRDRDLVLAEVELRSIDEEAPPPEWLAPYVVRDVTEDPAYLNANLAR